MAGLDLHGKVRDTAEMAGRPDHFAFNHEVILTDQPTAPGLGAATVGLAHFLHPMGPDAGRGAGRWRWRTGRRLQPSTD